MFIKVNAILENTQLKELGVQDETTVPIRIKAESVDAYRNMADEQGDVIEDECMIHMLTGGSFAVKATMKELDEKLEKALKEYVS